MNDRTESLPSSTSKHVFPQAHEMVFIRGQGEQAPLPNNKLEVTICQHINGRFDILARCAVQDSKCKLIWGSESTCGMEKGIYGSHI